MKTIVISLIVILLTVQESKANPFPYLIERQVFGGNMGYQMFQPYVYTGISTQTIPNELAPNLVTEDIKHLKESFTRLEKKFEELSKSLASAKSSSFDKYEKIGDKYYFFEDTQEVNWFAAVNKCEEINGQLVSFQNKEEFEAVSKKITKSYWLGINDLANDGDYTVSLTGQKANYLNWHSGEPNKENGNEHCAELKKKGSKYAMNDKPCHYKLNFICERKY